MTIRQHIIAYTAIIYRFLSNIICCKQTIFCAAVHFKRDSKLPISFSEYCIYVWFQNWNTAKIYRNQLVQLPSHSVQHSDRSRATIDQSSRVNEQCDFLLMTRSAVSNVFSMLIAMVVHQRSIHFTLKCILLHHLLKRFSLKWDIFHSEFDRWFNNWPVVVHVQHIKEKVKHYFQFKTYWI